MAELEGKIYKISCGDLFYYGSCTTTLPRRKYTHKQRCQTVENKLYKAIKDKPWTIELIELRICKSREELRLLEDTYVRPALNDSNCLNERCAVFNVEKDKKRKSEWYKANKDKILEKARTNYAQRKKLSLLE